MDKETAVLAMPNGSSNGFCSCSLAGVFDESLEKSPGLCIGLQPAARPQARRKRRGYFCVSAVWGMRRAGSAPKETTLNRGACRRRVDSRNDCPNSSGPFEALWACSDQLSYSILSVINWAS